MLECWHYIAEQRGRSYKKYIFKMHKLVAQEHIYLTENVLRSFSQNRITTLMEFLQEDVEKLSIISRLSIPQILEIRNNIFAKYSAPLVNGTKLLGNMLTCKQFVGTGIDSLDEILNNGIPVGFITEICGLAGCGKSQLCMQLSINCVKNTNSTVLYIDTKGDFSAVRIQNILDLQGFSYKDMAIIMLKIKIIHVWCMEELIRLFEELNCGTIIIENLSLIVIDSLPCLMFQHFGDDNKIGLKMLNNFVNYARHISKKMQIAVVCVNIHTRWIDQDFMDTEENEQSCGKTEPTCTVRWNRCLGKYWHNIPTSVLFLEQCQQTVKSSNCSTMKITVMKYNNPYNNKYCILELSSSGVA